MGFVGVLYISSFCSAFDSYCPMWSADNEKSFLRHTHVIQVGVNGAL